MKSSHLLAVAASAAFATLGGCASIAITPPDVPASLRAPADQSVFLEALATGTQIYECAANADQPATYEWTFRAPEAALADRTGRAIGKHYAGPTWESLDGSKVVGETKARDAGPDSHAIPWLLLTAKSTAGNGVLSATKSVQRVRTSGGSAPSQACTSANAGQVARVPYTATYYFYRAAS